MDASPAEVARAVTDSAGAFSFEVPGAGSYVLRVERLGYRTWSFPFELHDDDAVTATLVVLWTAAVPELEPVIVEAEAPRTRRPLTDFWERRSSSGSGSFITREEFEKQGTPRETTQVLGRMRGIRVRTNSAYASVGKRWTVTMSRRGCPPLYFVDRMLVGDAESVDIDAILPLVQVEAIEAYNGGPGVPPELNRPGARCGVIVFWTR